MEASVSAVIEDCMMAATFVAQRKIATERYKSSPPVEQETDRRDFYDSYRLPKTELQIEVEINKAHAHRSIECEGVFLR